MELFDLYEQVALVTGGSRGLGKSMAEGRARAGASILLSDVLDTTEAVEELREYTDDVIGVETDGTDRDDVLDENLRGQYFCA